MPQIPPPSPVLTLNLYLPDSYCWANFKTLLQRLGKISFPKSLLLFQGLNKKAFLRIILLGDMAQRKQSTTCSLKVDSAALVWMCGSSMRPRLGRPRSTPSRDLRGNVHHSFKDSCRTRLLWAADQGWPANYISCLSFGPAIIIIIIIIIILGQWKCYHHSSIGKCLWLQLRTCYNCWQRIQKS